MKNKNIQKTNVQLLKELEQLRAEITSLRKKEEDFKRTEELLEKTFYELSVHQEELTTQNEELKIAKEEIEDSHKKYRDLFDFAPIGYFTFDKTEIIKEVNLTGAELLGFSKKYLIGKPMILFVGKDYRDLLLSHFRGIFDGLYLSVELEIVKKDGNIFPVEFTSVPMKDNEGNIVSCRTVIMDITERKQAENALQKTKMSLANAQRIAKIGNWEHDFIKHKSFWSEELFRIFRFSPRVFHRPYEGYQLFMSIVHPEDRIFLKKTVQKALVKKKPYIVNYRIRLSNGFIHTIQEQAEFEFDKNGKITLMRGTVQDITAWKEVEEKIRHMALHDTLTKLPNRILFKDRLELSIAHAHRKKEKLAVLFLDLDGFKIINDTLGHGVGDKLLYEIACRLKNCVREDDTIARYGGDEFIFLLPGISDKKDITIVAYKILNTIKKPLLIDGHELYITTSIGIAMYPEDGQNAGILIKNADIAMYQAKESGKNNYFFYTPHMHTKVYKKMLLDKELRKAIEKAEFVVHYQPQASLIHGQINGVEALVRWQHAMRGLIYPAEFLSYAEDIRLIISIDEFVLNAACLQNKTWQRAGLQPLVVAVNLSANTFHQLNLVEMVTTILKKTDLDPQYLELEITERIAMNELEITIQKLKQLKELGIQIAIDDFGMGFSCLGYLKRFPIDKIKISQYFINHITTDKNDQVIVKSLIDMAHGLNFTVIAEGVENEEQRTILKQQGCDEIQGFLFCKPSQSHDIDILLKKESRKNDQIFLFQ